MKDEVIDYTFQKVVDFFEGLPSEVREDVYAVSFFMFNGDDDFRQPCLEVSYNTLSQVQKEGGDEEAKWNYAYWLQEPSVSVGYLNDSQTLVQAVLKDKALLYTDEEFESMDANNYNSEKLDSISDLVSGWWIEVVKKLYSTEVVKRVFGKNIPLLIHDCEHSDVSLSQRAIPEGVADDFYSYLSNDELP